MWITDRKPEFPWGVICYHQENVFVGSYIDGVWHTKDGFELGEEIDGWMEIPEWPNPAKPKEDRTEELLNEISMILVMENDGDHPGVKVMLRTLVPEDSERYKAALKEYLGDDDD